MAIPIGDDNDDRSAIPFVTYILIAINIGVFLYDLNNANAIVKQWAFIPRDFFADPASNAIKILTATFLHGGWAHIIGNMVYLWTFGDNVEDNFGHIPFLIFYLLAGVAAMMAQAFYTPGSVIPTVGASGAIAGVLGAYILLFPRGQVRLLTQAGVIAVPAILAIGAWIGLQFVSVAGEFASTKPNTQGGVAYLAHIGGFVAGFVLVWLFKQPTRPPRLDYGA